VALAKTGTHAGDDQGRAEIRTAGDADAPGYLPARSPQFHGQRVALGHPGGKTISGRGMEALT
jgi:hypothetical protein